MQGEHFPCFVRGGERCARQGRMLSVGSIEIIQRVDLSSAKSCFAPQVS